MNCPKCQASMMSVTVGEYIVERCTNCAGMWFDLREHEHLAESKAAVKSVDTGDPAMGAKENVQTDIVCPKCQVKMLKMAVPTQGHIHYESCPVCYGAFFDAGEFKDYAQYSLTERVKSFFSGFRRKAK